MTTANGDDEQIVREAWQASVDIIDSLGRFADRRGR